MTTAACPNADKHTPQPSGYLEWHDWAAKMDRTHRQEKCPGCGRFEIWVLKRPTEVLQVVTPEGGKRFGVYARLGRSYEATLDDAGWPYINGKRCSDAEVDRGWAVVGDPTR